MTDVAYQLLSKKKNSVTFNKLWDEVSQIMGYSENVAERKIEIGRASCRERV